MQVRGRRPSSIVSKFRSILSVLQRGISPPRYRITTKQWNDYLIYYEEVFNQGRRLFNE